MTWGPGACSAPVQSVLDAASTSLLRGGPESGDPLGGDNVPGTAGGMAGRARSGPAAYAGVVAERSGIPAMSVSACASTASAGWSRSSARPNGCGMSLLVDQYTSTRLPSGSKK